MALRQLKLQIELKQRKAELDALLQSQNDFLKREEDLKLSATEAKTDEDLKLVDEQTATLLKEVQDADNDTKIDGLNEQIKALEKELNDISEKSQEVKKPQAEEEKRGKSMNSIQVRELLKTGEYYERAEVKEFYQKFKNLRAVQGEELTVPDIVVNRIMAIMGDYSTIYPLVDKIKAKGTVRILIDTDTTPATWLEMTGGKPIPTGDVGTITDITFDGYKIGKITFVDNAMLKDSIINLDEYVTKKLARALSKGVDLAILKGTGSADKQPEGILTKLPEDNKKTVTVSDRLIADVTKNISLIDTGDDSIGNLTCVMKRQTYYNRFLDTTVNVNSSGDVVGKLPNLTNPYILGIPVVFNQNMTVDEVLFGDFEKYTLIERESISIDKSEHVKFTNDQTGFRGIGRFDGKPTKPSAFALVTLVDKAG